MGFTRRSCSVCRKFDIVAIITMIVVMLITAVETTGRRLRHRRDRRQADQDAPTSATVLRADGLATTIGGVFNSFPYTCFSENVGLVRLTGSRAAGWSRPPA